MLGYITRGQRGDGDRLLTRLARQLAQDGLRLAGAVQVNREGPDGACAQMDLVLLGIEADPICISQMLGAAAKGCRLNPEGLETAVGLIAAHLTDHAPQLVILNKFGKQEAEGGGVRPLIAQALEAGLPVLIHVSTDALPAFHDFAGDLAEHLPADMGALSDWCRAHVQAAA